MVEDLTELRGYADTSHCSSFSCKWNSLPIVGKVMDMVVVPEI